MEGLAIGIKIDSAARAKSDFLSERKWPSRVHYRSSNIFITSRTFDEKPHEIVSNETNNHWNKQIKK
jgi:hypothetical protein